MNQVIPLRRGTNDGEYVDLSWLSDKEIYELRRMPEDERQKRVAEYMEQMKREGRL